MISTSPIPPRPRASSIVDPRVGDSGPALLALEDGTVFAGIAFGASAAAGGDLVGAYQSPGGYVAMNLAPGQQILARCTPGERWADFCPPIGWRSDPNQPLEANGDRCDAARRRPIGPNVPGMSIWPRAAAAGS